MGRGKIISGFLLLCRNGWMEAFITNLEGTGEESLLRGKIITFEIIEFEVMIGYIFMISIR